MQYKYKTGMGIGLILLGALFLFEPHVAFVDVLPDIVGYVLLFAGLARLSDLNAHLFEARRRFRILLYISAGQLFGTYFIYGVLGAMMREKPAEMSRFEQPMTVLLCSFVLLVLQWYFLIPAFRELFAGMDALARRHDSESSGALRRNRTKGERMMRLSTVFVILSSLLATLPEASVLTSYEAHKGNPLFPFDWYRFIALFRGFAAVLSAIVGIVWLVAFLRYFLAVLRDSAFMERVRTQYAEDILPQTGMLTVRRLSAALTLLCVGIFFALNLRIGYRSALPGIVLAALVGTSLLLLGKLAPSRKECFAGAAALASVSAVQLIVTSLYLAAHLPEASRFESDAYYGFLAVRVIDAAEAVVTLVLIGILLTFLQRMAEKHTGVDYGTDADSRAISQAATQRLHREFLMHSRITFVLFALAAAVNVADAVFRLQYPWLWSVALLFSVAGVCRFFAMINELKTQIGYAYRSDGTNKNL